MSSKQTTAMISIDTNIGDLKELLNLATTQIEQLQATIKQINYFKLRIKS